MNTYEKIYSPSLMALFLQVAMAGAVEYEEIDSGAVMLRMIWWLDVPSDRTTTRVQRMRFATELKTGSKAFACKSGLLNIIRTGGGKAPLWVWDQLNPDRGGLSHYTLWFSVRKRWHVPNIKVVSIKSGLSSLRPMVHRCWWASDPTVEAGT